MRALRRAGFRQPVAQAFAEPLAVALEPVTRQRARPCPAGQHQGLDGDQGRKAARPFAQQVAEVEPEPLTLAARGLRVRFRQRPRFIGRALEHHVERMAGKAEGRIEPARGEVDEAVQLFRPHHRAGAVEAQQRDQRAVAADQRAGAAFERHRGLRREEAFQRLAAQRPAQALEVVRGGGEREGHRAVPPTAGA